MSLNRGLPFYHSRERETKFSPQHLKFEKGGIRSAGNTSLGPVDLHFSPAARSLAGREGGAGREQVFPISSISFPIEELQGKRSPPSPLLRGKQVVAVLRDRAFALEHEGCGGRHMGECQDARERDHGE